MKRILIIEDDDNLSRGIAVALQKDGYNAGTTNSITGARRLLQEKETDLIILDIGLPDGDGIELCKEIRAHGNTPVIMLTARDLETDEVSGFLAGADDYVTKPFSLSVLRARIEALLRRTEPANRHKIYSGKYLLDTNLCRFFKEKTEIPISATEYRLLSFLIENTGRVLTKERLLSALWDESGNFVDENTLAVNISRLRSKIEDDPKNPVTIKTVHGIGYMWNGGA